MERTLSRSTANERCASPLTPCNRLPSRGQRMITSTRTGFTAFRSFPTCALPGLMRRIQKIAIRFAPPIRRRVPA
eukprot:4080140-Pleurochrysis_carterae.AAC.1